MRRHTISWLICLVFFPTFIFANSQIVHDYVPGGRAPRFEGPVTVWIGGEDQLEGQYYVESVLRELTDIIPHVSIELVSSKSQANIRVYLTDSHEEWQQAIVRSEAEQATWQEKGQFIRGCTRVVSTASRRIKRADVILHLDFQTSGGQKLWVVRHEFMHALGVTGHPRNHPDSVLNSMQPQEDKNGLFSDDDKAVLQAIYAD
ncbi:MAG: DUF2927 domain-containing protein [Deltaproteobacteria bacterium]|nr:DUF2927 domain-containing protein [Deltaproteobacteria bacterium]